VKGAFRSLLLLAAWLGFASGAWAQLSGDQLGEHDMTPGSLAMVKGGMSNACLYCHAPHGGLSSGTPLWNQRLSIQTYGTYASSSYHQTGVQPALNSNSKMCLSCHDGTVAVGQTVAYGTVAMGGMMKGTSTLGTDLKASHPFSLKTPMVDSPNVNALLFASPARTADPAVQLVNGSIECTSCHEPHFQNVDKQLAQFLVKDSSSGQLCLACHDPARVVNGQSNTLAGWATSVHATSASATSNKPYTGGYSTVAQNSCNSCHMPHSAAGPARLLRGPNEQACIGCHAGSNLQPAAPDIFSEMSKIGHPLPNPQNLHDTTEGAILNNNRHATCMDCHNSHASQPSATFTIPPAIRLAQNAVVGVSATDGMTILTPAANQFENCFRCHGTSAGKGSTTVNYGYTPLRLVNASDPLNIISQFAATATSSHPVTHDRTSANPQPSLRSQMMQLDGTTPGRAMGVRILCTDCHNSDDNREFGGAGANGPHGSKYSHLLERRYDMSQAATPGGQISNPVPNPDLSAAGPYALCGKCHDLTQVLANTSFSQHSLHVQEEGFSCSVCHAGHGIGASGTSISGESLINFDINVVAPNGATPITFNRTARTCTLTCHGEGHNNEHY
jgi:predicted CXXCH cytochrome family protein